MSDATQPLPKPGTAPLRAEIADLESQSERFQRILEISHVLTSTLDIDQLLNLILDAAAELTNTERASIMWLDQKSGELKFIAATGSHREELANVRVPLEGSIAGTILRKREALVVHDVSNDPRHFQRAPQSIGFVTRSILGVPMTIKNHTRGVLEALNKKDDLAFTNEDVQMLMTFANQAAVAIENARLIGALRNANQQLGELDRLKSDFIAIASHELRTPLNLILGYASMLNKDASGEDAEQLQGVLKGAAQLRTLIDDMVNLQHFDAGGVALDAKALSVSELLQSVVESSQTATHAKNQTLRIDLPDTTLKLVADWDKTRLVVKNLVANAAKFTPAQGTIAISAKATNGEVQISVSDNGIGIPANDIERIFDRFYQVEPHISRKHGGMGLGLSIAKGLVELHNGRIWCESVEGKGSRFTIALPAQGPDSASQ